MPQPVISPLLLIYLLFLTLLNDSFSVIKASSMWFVSSEPVQIVHCLAKIVDFVEFNGLG